MLVPAVLWAVLTVGLPGPNGCGGTLESPPAAQQDQALPCDATSPATPIAAVVPGQLPGHVVFLNRGGATVTAGEDDATLDRSSVLTRRGLTQWVVPPASFTDAEWRSVVACVKQRFALFDLELVTERPTGSSYAMAVFGGKGSELGFDANIAGTAPIESSCRTVDRAVAFIFSGQLGADPQLHCEVAAQEIAHAFSADHSFVAADAMSYLPSSTPKTFQDLDAPCGEFQQRPCVCGRPSQNSFRLLLERLGPASRRGDLTAPQISLTMDRSRRGSASVTVHATDETSIAAVRLTVSDQGSVLTSTCGDGKLSCVPGADATTFTVTGVSDLAQFQATAVDGAGNLATAGAGEQIELHLLSAIDRTVTLVARSSAASSSAGLVWTQVDGTVLRRPLCQQADGTFSQTLKLADVPGARRMAIELTDFAGKVTASAAEDVAFQPR